MTGLAWYFCCMFLLAVLLFGIQTANYYAVKKQAEGWRRMYFDLRRMTVDRIEER